MNAPYTPLTGKREDLISSRAYADMLRIAEKTAEIIRNNNTPFEDHELRMICFDYTFSAMENFLEHIGWILIDDWDSKKSQSHYNAKHEKLMQFDFIEVDLQNKDDQALKTAWEQILKSVDLSSYNKKRNPIKHIHTGVHEIKSQTVEQTTDRCVSQEDFLQLMEGTYHVLTNEECEDFLNKVKEFISQVADFLNVNKCALKIYRKPENKNQAIKNRKALLRIILVAPWSCTFRTSAFSLGS